MPEFLIDFLEKSESLLTGRGTIISLFSGLILSASCLRLYSATVIISDSVSSISTVSLITYLSAEMPFFVPITWSISPFISFV